MRSDALRPVSICREFERVSMDFGGEGARAEPRAVPPGTGIVFSSGVGPGSQVLGKPAARNRARLLVFAHRQPLLTRPARPTGGHSDGPQRETPARNSNVVYVLHFAELGMVVAIEQLKRGVPMIIHHGTLRQYIRYAGLVGACALLLGPAVFRTAASSPNPRRDVLIAFHSD